MMTPTPWDPSDEAVEKVNVAFAILQMLDSAPANTDAIKDTVSKMSQPGSSGSFWLEALLGLLQNDYVRFDKGQWISTGKGLR